MNEKLIVKNFGPIRDAELELKKTTVLIGPQGSGKSTLAKLVAIFKDVNFYISEADAYGNQMQYFRNYLILSYFAEETVIDWESEVVKSNFKENQFNSKFSEKISLDFIENSKKENFNALDPNSYLSLTKFNNQRIINGPGSNMNKIGNSLFHKYLPVYFSSPIYIPSERAFFSSISESIFGLLNSNTALNKIILRLGSDFEKARIALNRRLKIPYLGIDYRYENGKDIISHFGSEKTKSNFEILLSESASGYQSVIPIHLIVEFFTTQHNINPDFDLTFKEGTDHSFLVEEPEINLYPTAQKELISFLVSRCAGKEHQLLLDLSFNCKSTFYNL